MTVLVEFQESVQARWFRIVVVAVQVYPALRMELYGLPRGKQMAKRRSNKDGIISLISLCYSALYGTRYAGFWPTKHHF